MEKRTGGIIFGGAVVVSALLTWGVVTSMQTVPPMTRTSIQQAIWAYESPSYAKTGPGAAAMKLAQEHGMTLSELEGALQATATHG